jgi:hypothetical protein
LKPKPLGYSPKNGNDDGQKGLEERECCKAAKKRVSTQPGANVGEAGPVKRQPRKVHDEKLGAFLFDLRREQYSGEISWEGVQVRVHFEGAQARRPRRCPSMRARSLGESEVLGRTHTRVRGEEAVAVEESSLARGGETRVPSKDFAARMRLVAITVHRGSAFDFWHEDGDLFWGHSIQISGDLVAGPTGADIPG